MAIQSAPPREVVLAIDNDNCVGSFEDLSMVYMLWRACSYAPPVEWFVARMEEYGCVRPGLRQLYEYIVTARLSGWRLHVVMCTAASNTSGWVCFLRKALETWFGDDVYDHVVDGQMMTAWHSQCGTPAVVPGRGWLVKDMNFVRMVCGVPCSTPVIMIDDRPGAVVNGTLVVGVAPYRKSFCVSDVMAKHASWWRPDIESGLGHHLRRHHEQWFREVSETSPLVVQEALSVFLLSLSLDPMLSSVCDEEADRDRRDIMCASPTCLCS